MPPKMLKCPISFVLTIKILIENSLKKGRYNKRSFRRPKLALWSDCSDTVVHHISFFYVFTLALNSFACRFLSHRRLSQIPREIRGAFFVSFRRIPSVL